MEPISKNLPRGKRGGLARLANFLQKERQQSVLPLLILSGGGEVAGGPYDLQEGAPNINRLRSDLILRTLSACRYDAICLGDEEFGLGLNTLTRWQKRLPCPLLSANVKIKGVKLPFLPSVIVKRKGVKVGIVGLTTPELSLNEFGLALPERTKVLAPLEVAKEMAKELAPRVDLLLFLSHLGEEENCQLLASLKVPAIVFSSHRRLGKEIYYRYGVGWLVNFDYGVTKVHELTVKVQNREILEVKTSIHLLDECLEEKQTVAKQVEVAQKLAGSTRTLDIYSLAECPHCEPIETMAAKLAKKWGRKLLLRKYTLTPPKEKPAHRLAESHLWRAERLGVNKSPEILIGNVPFMAPPHMLPKTLEKIFQQKREPASPSLPSLQATVWLSSKALRPSINNIIQAIDYLLPGAKIEFKWVGKKSRRSPLPQILISGAIEEWPDFQEVLSDHLVPGQKAYGLSTAYLPATYFPQRKEKRKHVLLLAKEEHAPWVSSMSDILHDAYSEVAIEFALLDSEREGKPPRSRRLTEKETKKLVHSFSVPLPLPSILLNNRELLLPQNEKEAILLLQRAHILPLRGRLEK